VRKGTAPGPARINPAACFHPADERKTRKYMKCGCPIVLAFSGFGAFFD
jgi:hypothetical protein